MFFTHVERDPCLFRLSRVSRGRMALGILVFSAGILSVLRPVAAWGNENQGAPNIVLIITDDQGYGDLGCHGNPVLKTPHLDKLHSESVRFTDFHVGPTCAPTRSALMTGHWSNRTGVWHTINGRSILREDEVTLAQLLADAGYATGMFGKWHLGDNYPSRPQDRGFEEVLCHGGGGVGQTPDYWDNAYFDGAYFHNGKPTPVKGFCTDVFFDYALQFIERSRDARRPFFAYIAPNAPHSPWHAPQQYADRYADLPLNTAHFFGMITNIDDNVGRLRAKLAQWGLAENTILVFMTDNGTAGGAKVFNAGMRGHKGSEYEGGHRVPLFVHWPAGGLNTGRDAPELAAHVDVAPTLLDLAGVTRVGAWNPDGRSLRPLLEANSGDPVWRTRVLITDSQRILHPEKWRKSAVMQDRWRLINGKELYDVGSDPGQKTDVAPNHPAVVGRLRDAYEQWWARISPSFADDCEIVIGHPAENPSRLTCHDWMCEGYSPWNQGMIRALRVEETAPWAVQVHESGEYEITLRRWPEEIDHPIRAGLPPGKPVPGQKAFRTTPGVGLAAVKARVECQGKTVETGVPADASAVTLHMTLQAGPARLLAVFLDDGGRQTGAFYVYVRKL